MPRRAQTAHPRLMAWKRAATCLGGMALAGWTAVQVEMFGYRMWWQPVCLALGLLTVLLSFRGPRRDRTAGGVIVTDSMHPQQPIRGTGMRDVLRRSATHIARGLHPPARGIGFTREDPVRQHVGDLGYRRPEERQVADGTEIHHDDPVGA